MIVNSNCGYGKTTEIIDKNGYFYHLSHSYLLFYVEISVLHTERLCTVIIWYNLYNIHDFNESPRSDHSGVLHWH